MQFEMSLPKPPPPPQLPYFFLFFNGPKCNLDGGSCRDAVVRQYVG